MGYVDHRCPNCGANLPPPPPSGSVRCEFCATRLAVEAGRWKASAPEALDEPLRDPERPRLWVGGARYCVLGRLAKGEASDVFLARRDARVTELVVLKISSDAARLGREWAALEALPRSTAEGSAHFARLLPQPVATGTARLGMHGNEGDRPVSVLRWRSGFIHTFDDVFSAYPGGVPPESSIWMWKRMLELLGWVHRSGWSHGAVTPAHLLMHARDHGVVLVGWSRASKSPGAADIAASATVIQRALGSQRAPAALADLLAQTVKSPPSDAWALKETLDRTARDAFGPPKYVPSVMPDS